MKINIQPSITFFFILLSNLIFGQSGAVMIKSADTDKWGYVDLQGNMIVEANLKSAHSFSTNGIAWIEKDNEARFINAQGEVLNLPEFDSGKKNFHDGLIALKNKKKKWGFADASGNLVFPFLFDNITEFKDGNASAEIDGEWYALNTKGEKMKYMGELREMKKFSEGLSVIYSKDKLHGFVDHQAKVVIKPSFKSVGYFENGLAWAKDDEGLAGYIDKQGNWVIRPKYDAVGDFDEASGLARVKLDGNWMYVDKSGAVVKAPSNTDLYGHFKSGLAKGRVDKLVGFYDKSGTWVIKPQFEAVRDFNDGFAAAKKDDKWGVIDTKGNWVVEPKYIGIKDPVVFK